jgi:hypothetical protein
MATDGDPYACVVVYHACVPPGAQGWLAALAQASLWFLCVCVCVCVCDGAGH